MRSKAAEEQPATRRLGPTMTQVGNDGCADISRHRDPCPLPALCANEHLAGSPIDIVQGQGRDLVGTQAELGEHHQDSVIPPPHGACPIATVEDLLHLRGG